MKNLKEFVTEERKKHERYLDKSVVVFDINLKRIKQLRFKLEPLLVGFNIELSIIDGVYMNKENHPRLIFTSPRVFARDCVSLKAPQVDSDGNIVSFLASGLHIFPLSGRRVEFEEFLIILAKYIK